MNFKVILKLFIIMSGMLVMMPSPDFVSLSSASQISEHSSPLSIGGSFAIAAICKNGILIAADSRGTISNDSGQQLAYYENVQKVFPIGNKAIAYTGRETIQNLYFGAIVDAFAETLTKEIPLDQLLPTFLNFTDSKLPPEANRQVRDQHLFAAGYVDGKPAACYYNEAQTDGPKTKCGLGFVASDQTIVDNYKQNLRSMECLGLSELIRDAILLYANDKKTVSIGAPINVREISLRGTRWIGIEPIKRKWNNLHEFAAAYWRGEVDLHLLPGATKSEVEQLIKRGEDWSKNSSNR